MMIRFKRILLLLMAVSWVLRPSDAQDVEQIQKEEAKKKVTSSEHEKDEDIKKEITPAEKDQDDESTKKSVPPENGEEHNQQTTESSAEDTTKKRDRKDRRRSKDGKRREGKSKDRSKDKERKKGREKPLDFTVTIARGKRSTKKVFELPLTHSRTFLTNRAPPDVRPGAAMASANFVRRFVDSSLSQHPKAKLYRRRMKKNKMDNNYAF